MSSKCLDTKFRNLEKRPGLKMVVVIGKTEDARSRARRDEWRPELLDTDNG
jgi:hypothetical protein